MKPFVLYGAGQFADYVQYILEETLEEKVAAFVVDRKYLSDGAVLKNGLPLLAFEDVLECYSPDRYNMAIAFLNKDMYVARERAFKKCMNFGYDLPNIIHPTVVNHSQQIGVGNIIGARTVLEPFSVIGDANVFFDMSLVSHNAIVGSFNLLASNIVPCGNCVIGSHCFIGAGSIVKNVVRVADYTLVGAGAYVNKDTAEYDVVVPARSVTLEHKKSTDFQLQGG